tara:strand:+ start:4769 stop:5980 length:1212 start_codon:yes stop_codon:yes gene_type:complete
MPSPSLWGKAVEHFSPVKTTMLIRHTAILACSLLAAVTLGGCERGEPEQETPPRVIAWTEVKPYTGGDALRSLPGVVRAVKRASIGFEVGGTLESVGVDVGDRFEQHQLLAQLNQRDFKLGVERARAAVAEARARAREAENDFDRLQALAAENFASQSALDSARAALDTARSRVATTEASLALAEDDLSDAELRAPYAGEVSARLAEPSQQISPGQPILRIQGSPDNVEVVVSVPETFVHRVQPGSEHVVTFPARPGLSTPGKVTEIGSDATELNAYPVTLLLGDTDNPPRPGMTAEVAFPLDPAGVVTHDKHLVVIPVAAFLPVEGQGKVAFVYDEDTGTVRRRPVSITQLTGNSALVSEGLQAGEVIASKGLEFLRDSEPVLLMGKGTARSEQPATVSESP